MGTFYQVTYPQTNTVPHMTELNSHINEWDYQYDPSSKKYKIDHCFLQLSEY